MASSPSVLQAPAKPDFRHDEGALRSAASTHDGLARSPNFDAPPPEHRPRLPSISTISQDTSPQSPSTASTSTPASGHSSALGPVVAFQCPSERCKNNPMWRFSRLDIFKMHVQRCHPEEDVDRLISRYVSLPLILTYRRLPATRSKPQPLASWRSLTIHPTGAGLAPMQTAVQPHIPNQRSMHQRLLPT